MKGKIIKLSISRTILLILLIAAVLSPLVAFGVSYPPQLYHREEKHDIFVKGDIVYLFHSGVEGMKKTIHISDTLAVYRVTPTCEIIPIGIIRVISFVGENYIKGEVFAGEIRPDDIAKKDKVSCLVISAGVCKE